MKIKNRLYPSSYFDKHPRMAWKDFPIWKQYLVKNHELYENILYDYPVGEGARQPRTDPTIEAEGFAHLTKKRVDAVGTTATEIHLFEVKPRLTPGSCGQILGYKHLYERQHPGCLPIEMFVLCQLANEDDLYCAKKCGIHVVLIE